MCGKALFHWQPSFFSRTMLNHTQQDFVADESRCQLQPGAAALCCCWSWTFDPRVELRNWKWETRHFKIEPPSPLQWLIHLIMGNKHFVHPTTFSASWVRWLAVLKKHLLRRWSFVELKREIQSFYSDLKTFIDQNNFSVNPVSDHTRLLSVLKCKWSTHLCGVKALYSE